MHFIDVQHEIVDHLATAIEEEDSSLSFEEALRSVYSKFPVTGFTSLAEAKTSAIYRYWKRRFFSFMLSYLKLPKVIIAVLLVLILHSILQNGNVFYKWHLHLCFCILFFGSIIYRIKKGFKFKKEIKAKLLVTQAYFALSGVSWLYIFYIPLNLLLDNKQMFTPLTLDPAQCWILSTFLTLILLWVHAITFEFPKLLEKELSEKYRHLNMRIT